MQTLVKVEGKVDPVHAMKAYGRSRGIAPLIPTVAIYIAMTSRWLFSMAHGFFHINTDTEDNAVINWGGG
jgi:hypothetical protein